MPEEISGTNERVQRTLMQYGRCSEYSEGLLNEENERVAAEDNSGGK